MRYLLVLLLGLPLPAAASLALGRPIGAAAPAMAAPLAMAWAVNLRKPLRHLGLVSTLPEFQNCLTGLGQLDLSMPRHWEILSPVVMRLDKRGVRPAEFNAMSVPRKQELLVDAVKSVANDKRAQAALLMLRVGKAPIRSEELAIIKEEAKKLKGDALFLTDTQNESVRDIARRASNQLGIERAERTLAFAKRVGKKLTGSEVVLRTAVAPDGRKVQLLRKGTRYRVWFEGDGEPAVEYDLQKTEGNDIVAFPVIRDGRRGIHVDGKVLWEDGVY